MARAYRWGRWALVGAGALLLGWLVWPRREVGAWTLIGEDSDSQIARAKSAGVNRLSLFCNGRADLPGPWLTRDPSTLKAYVAAFKAGGLAVSLCSWLTPAWVRQGAGAALGKLAVLCKVDEVDLDLEEEGGIGWSGRGLSDVELEALADRFFGELRAAGFSGRVAVNCIVYGDMRALGPMIRRADRVIPQSYATRKNTEGLAAGALEAVAVERYRVFAKPIVLGVAAFKLEGAYGQSSPAAALALSLEAAERLGVRAIRVWWLPTIGDDLAPVLASFARGREASV